MVARKQVRPDTAAARFLNFFLAHFRFAFTNRSRIDPRWRTHLSRPCSLYGLSSWSYTAIGLLLLSHCLLCPAALAEWAVGHPTLALGEACALTLQGGWSFLSDVLNIGRTSWLHSLDRVSALTLTFLQLVKFGVIMVPGMSAYELAYVWGGIGIGVAAKLMGSRAILDQSMAGFRGWHTVWHLELPAALGGFLVMRWRTCADCDGATCG